MGWSAEFDEPIERPDGLTFRTLRDAGMYILKLPKEERRAMQWQTALGNLLLAAEHDGPISSARMGVMQALNRKVERVSNPSGKDTHRGKRKLKRDQ